MFFVVFFFGFEFPFRIFQILSYFYLMIIITCVKKCKQKTITGSVVVLLLHYMQHILLHSCVMEEKKFYDMYKNK